MGEMIAAVPKEIIEINRFIVNKHADKNEIERIFKILLENYKFVDRDFAENDYTLKQIIPYILVNHGDKYLLIKRTKKQSETRLHDKFSLGIGGHINDTDTSKKESNIILEGFYRELNEELEIHEPYKIECLGIIDDEREEVGRVHMGIVYKIELSDDYFKLLEADKMTGNWAGIDEIKEKYDFLEGWSKALVESFIK